MNMVVAEGVLARAGITPPTAAGGLQIGLEKTRALIERASTFEEAIIAAGAAEGMRRTVIGMDVPKAIVADAAELMVWAQRRVGEMLGEVTQGQRTDTQPSPCGESLDRNARHRYREIAGIDEGEIVAYLAGAREKYLADEARIGAFSPRTILRYFDIERPADRAPEIVKPSDNWNFNKPVFDRIPGNIFGAADKPDAEGEKHPHGYIPGDIYASALHYWSKPGDVVVAPMAGSGMILRVYEKRDWWMKPEPWDLDIVASDLNPRGPYKHMIERRDALDGLPCEADLVIADIPYFGMCEGLYSKDARDLGNMALEEYRDGLLRMAAAWEPGLRPAGRIVVIASATYTDTGTKRRVMIMPTIIEAFAAANLDLVDIAFASRRIQQAQNPNMARMNLWAREKKAMLSDMAVAMCFGRMDRPSS